MTDLPSKGPEGSWIITVKYDDPTVAPFHALITYSAGGGLVESDQGNPPGHGAWVSTGANTFAFTFVTFLYDANRNPTGTMKVREAASLSEAGDAYTGAGTIDLFDVNGNLLASHSLQTQARRILTEPL